MKSARTKPIPKATRLTQTELVLEAHTGTTLARRWWPGLVVAAILALIVVYAVREVRRVELVLAAEGERVTRVVAYELAPERELHIPIDPSADLLRVVVHALTRYRDLPLEAHPAKLSLRIKGRDGNERTEVVTTSLPGISSRVTAEEGELAVGDPVAVTLDVRRRRGGEVIVRLDGVENADAVLVRAYSRETLDAKDAKQRLRSLDDKRRLELASRAWELDFGDLPAAEQDAIAGARWHKVGALRGAGDELKPHAMAVATRPVREPRGRTESLFVGRATIAKDEILGVMAESGAKLTVIADGAPDAVLIATVRRGAGAIVHQGAGTLDMTVDGEGRAGIEIASNQGATIVVRALDPSRVTWLGHQHVWRATRARHAILRAGPTPLVVRVTARRPMPRENAPPNATLTMDVALSGARVTQRFSATVPRSRFDHYDGQALTVPSERVHFHVVVPPDKTIELTPQEPAVDLSFAELDVDAPPRPLETRPGGQPATTTGQAVLGETEWHGFVPRRPSNVEVFFERADPDGGDEALNAGALVLRTAHRWSTMTKGSLPIVHVARPSPPIATDEHGHAWVALGPLLASRPATGAGVVPLRLSAKEKTVVTIKVDPGSFERRPGLAQHITLERSVVVDGDVATSFVLGDDLAPGAHHLVLTADRRVDVKMQASWTVVHGSRAPHWISGDFEE